MTDQVSRARTTSEAVGWAIFALTLAACAAFAVRDTGHAMWQVVLIAVAAFAAGLARGLASSRFFSRYREQAPAQTMALAILLILVALGGGYRGTHLFSAVWFVPAGMFTAFAYRVRGL